MLNWIKKKFKGEKEEDKIIKSDVVENVENISEEETDKEINEEVLSNIENPVEEISEIDLPNIEDENLTQENIPVEDSSEEVMEEDIIQPVNSEEKEELESETELQEDIQETENFLVEETLEDEVLDNSPAEETLEDEVLVNSPAEEKLEDEVLDKSSKDPIEAEAPKEKGSFFHRLKNGLSKTRTEMGNKINEILGAYVKIDDEMLEDLEDLLISADIGMETTMLLIDNLRSRIISDKVKDPMLVKGLLAEEMKTLLKNNAGDTSLNIEPSPAVILVVGVNGVGKTTTIGKLTQQLKNDGKTVLIAAGDTFRAAAIEQLKTWGQRSNTEVIAHQEGADPAAVIYDAIQAAKSRNVDVLICDTAGRLHNKKNLMNELEKIHRIIERDFPEAQKEALLVLDATTGQNAILQAKTFNEVTELTGIALTKLDGTAKGGVVLPLVNQLSIPIKLIGVGEGINDLQKFNEDDFAKALLDID